jgi:uncharacterized iron-regulated membrane protein
LERTYLTFTLVSAVISVLLIFFGAILLGLWCGWMRWGRRDPRREAGTPPAGERPMDWATIVLFVLLLALIVLGTLALFEGYLPGATR